MGLTTLGRPLDLGCRFCTAAQDLNPRRDVDVGIGDDGDGGGGFEGRGWKRASAMSGNSVLCG